MTVHRFHKVIAIFVIIAFVWIGLAWASESSTPKFQEKEQAPVVKKHKKFPVLLALLGAAAIGAGIYFLTKKKSEENQVDEFTADGTVTASFSGAALAGIPVYFVGGGKTFTATTDGAGHFAAKIPNGTYSILYNISDANVIGDKTYIPSKLSGVSVNSNKTINMDLAEYAILFPVPSEAVEVRKAYRGTDLDGVNKRWDHNPTVFVAYVASGFKLNEANLLEAYKRITKYTDGFIQAPTSMANVIVKNQDPDPDNLEKDAVIFYTQAPGAAENIEGNVIVRSFFDSDPNNKDTMYAEAPASVQGGNNESKIIRTIFDGEPITSRDLNWGKFNYRLRKPGERIYFVSGNDACEDRIL